MYVSSKSVHGPQVTRYCAGQTLNSSCYFPSSTRTMATKDQEHPLGPFKLVTVNTAPERAKRIVGRLCEEMKDRYIIDHVANSESEYLSKCMQLLPHKGD